MFCYVVAYYEDYEGLNMYDEDVCVFMKKEDAKFYAHFLNKKNGLADGVSDCYVVEKIPFANRIEKIEG